MATMKLNVTIPRRQAMLSIVELRREHSVLPENIPYTREYEEEVARVPVFVWPMPTHDGYFIVEHQDGHCQKVQPYELTFLGSKELFDQYEWTEE